MAVPVVGVQLARNVELSRENDALHAAAAVSSVSNVSNVSNEHLRTGLALDTPTRPFYSRFDLTTLFAEDDTFDRIQQLLAFAKALPLHEIEPTLQDIRASRPEWDSEGKLVRQLLLGRWGETDPDAAFASLEKLDLKTRAEDSVAVLAGLSARDPARAAALLADPVETFVDVPYLGHFLAGALATQWVRRDQEAALAWAQTLPEEQRAGAYHGALGILAGSDPEQAAAIASRELGPAEDGPTIIRNIARS